MMRATWASVLITGTAVCAIGAAQPQPRTPASRTPGPPAAAVPTAEQRAAARALTRLALMDLRLREDTTPLDARLDGLVLSLAHDLDPANAELVRTELWLSDGADRPEATDALLRKLVEFDPRDLHAQYRLIAGRLARIQSVEERLAGYERFLGAQGTSLDPTIRSRLAYDASVLLREGGNEAGAVAKLKLATALDATNKDAAVAAYEFFRSKLEDLPGRAELVANVLMADPVDLATHLEMARVMAAGGAFDQAKRFQTSTISIMERYGGKQGADGVIESLCVDWPLDGPAKVAAELTKALAIRRNDMRKNREFMEAQNIPLMGVPLPEEMRLEPSLDRLRLVSAVAARDTPTVQSAAQDLRDTYEGAIDILVHPPAGTVIDLEDLPGQARSFRIELITMLSWGDVDAERLDKELEEVAADTGNDPSDPAFLEARGWRLARSAEPAKAIDVLRPLAATRPAARVGLATALERAGRTDEALTEYRAIAREQAATPEGAWSWYRISEITGRKDAEPEIAKKMRAFGATIPAWIDEAAADPERIMTLTAELRTSTLDAAEPASLVVRLTNITSIPLGVGSDRTINSRLLLSPSLDAGLASRREGVTPELLDMGRRLRLMPRESLEVTCWPDPGFSGWLSETLATETVRLRWRVIQGFTVGAEGQVVPGPMCLSAGTQSLVRTPLPETAMTPAQLVQEFGAAPEKELDRLAIAVRSLLLAPLPKPKEPKRAAGDPAPEAPPAPALPRLSAEDTDLIAKAIAERFATCSVAGRLLLGAMLPHAGQVPAMKVLDEALRADKDPAVAAMFLVSRVTAADDEALKRAIDSSDPRLIEVAKLHGERLAAGGIAYGNLGPGLTGLLQPEPVKEEEPPATTPAGSGPIR